MLGFSTTSLWICKSVQVLSASYIITNKDTASKMLPYTFSNLQSTIYVYVHFYANLMLSLETAEVQISA